MIFDDIAWGSGMAEAWEEIQRLRRTDGGTLPGRPTKPGLVFLGATCEVIHMDDASARTARRAALAIRSVVRSLMSRPSRPVARP